MDENETRLITKLDDVEPICAVGNGVAGLCMATAAASWLFESFNLTAVPTYLPH